MFDLPDKMDHSILARRYILPSFHLEHTLLRFCRGCIDCKKKTKRNRKWLIC